MEGADIIWVKKVAPHSAGQKEQREYGSRSDAGEQGTMGLRRGETICSAAEGKDDKLKKKNERRGNADIYNCLIE